MINERLPPRSEYFNDVRPEILALVVGTPESVCEIGCGTGALLTVLHRRGAKQLRGIELRSDVAQLARARGFIDGVYVGDVSLKTGLEAPSGLEPLYEALQASA